MVHHMVIRRNYLESGLYTKLMNEMIWGGVPLPGAVGRGDPKDRTDWK